MVLVSTNIVGKGVARKITYEDIRLVPCSSLIKELDEIESSEILSTEKKDSVPSQPEERTYFAEMKQKAKQDSISDDVSRDIGTTAIQTPPKESVLRLASDEQEILLSTLKVLGTEHVTQRELDFLPQ